MLRPAMTTHATTAAALQTIARTLRAGAYNALRHLPGERPAAIVVELAGVIAPRAERPRFLGLPIHPPGAPRAPSLEALTETFEALAAAPWVRRVALRVDGVHADPATLYALRGLLSRLRGAGKHTVAYLADLSLPAYYLASAASEVAAPESAEIALHGLAISVTFMRDALAKIGVRFEKIAEGEYKNALDPLVRSDMSGPHREQLEALLDRIYEHHVAAVAEGRGLPADRVRALFDEPLTSAEEARAAGLLDRVAYEDEIIGEDHRPISEARRFLGARAPALGRRVALVTIAGTIVMGKSRGVPLPVPGVGGRTAGSETIVRALRAAGADDRTAAAVLFVDSPGGSALASDVIWREVRRLREKKPVVAVMGSTAASGGYYVLTPATRVLAAPTTITGSIGVFTGKLVVEDLFARAGLHTERVQRGRYAMLHDPTRPLGDDERGLLERSNAQTYDRFVARVAEGRRLSADQVHALARGRIWSGVDAVAHGLADEIGDLQAGIARAREIAGVDPDAPVWDVPAPEGMVLPYGDAEALLEAVLPLTREHTWLMLPARLRIG